MTKSLLLILFLSFTLSAFAQKNYIISGTIKDKSTGEQLIGATIRIQELPQNGTATNSYGFYSLSAPEGDYTLLFSYIGYETVIQKVSLHQSIVMNMGLPSKSELKEVEKVNVWKVPGRTIAVFVLPCLVLYVCLVFIPVCYHSIRRNGIYRIVFYSTCFR